MSPPNDSNSFRNNIIVIFSVLAILIISGYLGYVMGRDDKEDYLQQQKSEQQIEKRNKVN